MDRQELYDVAVQVLAREKRLICQWATGVGKSQVALQFLKAREGEGLKTLIVVPETDNIDNWKTEFRKFDVSRQGVEIICYASLHRYLGTKWDLLVLDEVPHMDTDKRKQYLQTIEAKHVLALGAIIDYYERESLTSVYGYFYVSDIPIAKAIEMGILVIPKIFVLHIQLDSKELKHWHYGKKISDWEYYNMLDNKVASASQRQKNYPSARNKQAMLMAGSERKRFLGKLKTEKASRVCSKLNEKGKRFVCFCSSIAQAMELGGDCAFTSMTKTSEKLLQRFNNKEIDSLYVVGKLIEGQNLTDIECGVIAQLGGTDRITVQSIGRIMRSKQPVVYVLTMDETQDAEYLRTLTDNIPEEYIKHYNY